MSAEKIKIKVKNFLESLALAERGILL